MRNIFSKERAANGKSAQARVFLKRAAAIAAASLLLIMTGCGAAELPDNTEEAQSADVSPQQSESPAETTENAFDFVGKIGIGWNLGNSLDALGDGVNSETAWGNPRVTRGMILDIQKMGFTTVRIPVSWGRHVDGEGKVDAEWMARVKEVVDYAYDAGMYVILNSHHDNSYYNIGGCVKSDETKRNSIEKMKLLWTQIAGEFIEYDEHLIFETINEPRTEGSAKEWSGGTEPERKVVDELNREIISAIRATGGNNAVRYVMLPGYAATPDMSLLGQMELPEDGHIIVSVHAYSPYPFAMKGSASGTFTDSDRRELDGLFKAMDEFMKKKGVPIIIGEFGATNKDNLADRCAWADYYVKGAGKYGIPCVVWDNNIGVGKGEEIFGLYNRSTGGWYFPELAEAYVNAAK